MKAIEIINLSKTYRGKRGMRVEALTNLSLELSQGEVFGFLGPNGAGKSTTIKILMGLIPASAGSAKLNGADVRTVEARKRVGFLPENPAFYDFLSAGEYLQFSGRAFGMNKGELKQRVEEVLELLDLTLDDHRWKSGLKEIARLREVISAWFCGQTLFDISPKDIEDYCVNFVIIYSDPIIIIKKYYFFMRGRSLKQNKNKNK